MAKEIISIFEESTQKFSDALAAFNESQLNEVPFVDSWTPAQVADHVLKSQARFPQLLAGKTADANRMADEKKEAIAQVFLDFSTKMKSPEFILPTTEPLEKTALLKRIAGKGSEITNAMEVNDLNRICLDFELPNMGQFTGLEWCWFQVFHMQRHTRQLENIYKKIGSKQTSTG